MTTRAGLIEAHMMGRGWLVFHWVFLVGNLISIALVIPGAPRWWTVLNAVAVTILTLNLVEHYRFRRALRRSLDRIVVNIADLAEARQQGKR